MFTITQNFVTFSLLTSALLTSISFPPAVHCIEEAFCAGVGYSDLQDPLGGAGLKSMGASEWYAGILNTIWSTTVSRVNVAPSGRIFLKVSHIEGPAADGTERDLNGWLELKITNLQSPNKFVALAMWAITDKGETFGEFHTFASQCSKQNSAKGDKWAEDESALPCSATPISNARNPNMFLYTNQHHVGHSQINVLWRADVTVCNKPSKFRFMVVANTEKWYPLPKGPIYLHETGTTKGSKLGPYVIATSWMEPHFYGPAAPLDPQRIQCAFGSILQETPVWFTKRPVTHVNGQFQGILVAPERKYVEPRWTLAAGNVSVENVAAVKAIAVCKAQESGVIPFGGRCTGTVESTGGTRRIYGTFGTPPRCDYRAANFNATENQRIQGNGHFKDFVNGKKTAAVTKMCDCPRLPTTGDIQGAGKFRKDPFYMDAKAYDILGEGCRDVGSLEEYNTLGLCKHTVAGKYAEGIRVTHAVMQLLCAVILVPLSCYVTRYMKGRIPHERAAVEERVPVRSWYLAHIYMVLPLVSMYVGSTNSVLRQKEILGRSRSQSALVHRLMGYSVMSLVAFEVLTGFIRPPNLGARKVWIFVHWFAGIVVYYGGVLACIFSYRIPASPFSYKRHVDSDFGNVLNHPCANVLMGWMIADLLFHTCVTGYFILYDFSRLHVRNSICAYFPVILPQRHDAYHFTSMEQRKHQGHLVQNLFFVYILFCVLTFIAVLVFMASKQIGQGFGNMQCTHDKNGVFTAGLEYQGNFTVKDVNELGTFCGDLDDLLIVN